MIRTLTCQVRAISLPLSHCSRVRTCLGYIDERRAQLASRKAKNRVFAVWQRERRCMTLLVVGYLKGADMLREWRKQELALFALRAHRQFGRGFVLSDRCEVQPVYITWIMGAPQPLIEAVLGYDPKQEAVVVSRDESCDDTMIINRVKIQQYH